MAVIDAEDRKIGRIDHSDGSQRADIHQKLAVADHDQYAFVGAS